MSNEPNKSRNMELIRDLLLTIESQPAGALIRQIEMPGIYTKEEVIDHMRLVAEADLLNGRIEFTNSRMFLSIHGLTNKGHDLLDSIRSETVWVQTKEKVKEVGGTVSIDTLKAVATAIATKMLLG